MATLGPNTCTNLQDSIGNQLNSLVFRRNVTAIRMQLDENSWFHTIHCRGMQEMPKRQPSTHDSVATIEHRVASRYAMRVPVELLFEDGDRLRVFTHNVSASGIFVSVDKDRKLKGFIRFLMTFPKEITTSCSLLALCDGAVVRREPAEDDEEEALAIKIEKYHFLRSAG